MNGFNFTSNYNIDNDTLSCEAVSDQTSSVFDGIAWYTISIVNENFNLAFDKIEIVPNVFNYSTLFELNQSNKHFYTPSNYYQCCTVLNNSPITCTKLFLTGSGDRFFPNLTTTTAATQTTVAQTSTTKSQTASTSIKASTTHSTTTTSIVITTTKTLSSTSTTASSTALTASLPATITRALITNITSITQTPTTPTTTVSTKQSQVSTNTITTQSVKTTATTQTITSTASTNTTFQTITTIKTTQSSSIKVSTTMTTSVAALTSTSSAVITNVSTIQTATHNASGSMPEKSAMGSGLGTKEIAIIAGCSGGFLLLLLIILICLICYKKRRVSIRKSGRLFLDGIFWFDQKVKFGLIVFLL